MTDKAVLQKLSLSKKGHQSKYVMTDKGVLQKVSLSKKKVIKKNMLFNGPSYLIYFNHWVNCITQLKRGSYICPFNPSNKRPATP